jgi:hypothetical protein
LIGYGRTVLTLRSAYIAAERKLFTELQKIMNQFKNEQRAVYNTTEEYGAIEEYGQYIDEKAGFEQLCTITDVDYIKSVMDIQCRT